MFNRALSDSPYRLVFALDGEDAYDRFSEVKPDLVLTDLDLLRLDASELCALIRKDRRGASVPIVVYGEALGGSEIARQTVEALDATSALVEGWGPPEVREVLAEALPVPVRRVPPSRESSQLTDPGSSPDLTSLEDQDVQITLDGEGDLPMLDTKLAVEAMAQLGGLLLSQKLEHTGKIAVLLSLDRVKLRHPVTPGDQVVLEAETIRASSRTASIRGTASVGGKLAAEANIRFMMVDGDQE